MKDRRNGVIIKRKSLQKEKNIIEISLQGNSKKIGKYGSSLTTPELKRLSNNSISGQKQAKTCKNTQKHAKTCKNMQKHAKTCKK